MTDNIEYSKLADALKSQLRAAGFEELASAVFSKCVFLSKGLALKAFVEIEPAFKKVYIFSHLKLQMSVFLTNIRRIDLLVAEKTADIMPEEASSPSAVTALVADVFKEVAEALGEAASTAAISSMTGEF